MRWNMKGNKNSCAKTKFRLVSSLLVVTWSILKTKMATHFSAKQIEEFRECFAFYCQQGAITSVKELTLVLRSLGLMATIVECRGLYAKYTAKQGQKGAIDFPTLLELIRDYQSGHSEDQAFREIAEGLRCLDKKRSGTIAAGELRRILSTFGERMTNGEIDALLRELRVSASPQAPVSNEQLVNYCRK